MVTIVEKKYKYEYVFRVMNKVYARLYDSEIKDSILKEVKSVPDFYIPTKEKTEFIGIPYKNNLKKISFNSIKEYKENIELYKKSKITLFGNKSLEQTFINANWKNTMDCFHEFNNMWFYDIETAVGIHPEIPATIPESSIKKLIKIEGENSVDVNNEIKNGLFSLSIIEKLEKHNLKYKLKEKSIKYYRKLMKNDWKPMNGERSAKARITSIQIYDTKSDTYLFLILNRDIIKQLDLTNINKSYSKVKFINCLTEENLLKNFLTILNSRKPTLISGWNSEVYDEPYITNRISRILDNNQPYISDKSSYNLNCLSGKYVKQLSPVNFIKHKSVNTNFGIQDRFEWTGIIQADYLNLYKKYTYTTHTSNSLSSIATFELGDDKVSHDEFTDFKDFYQKDLQNFVEYGLKDVQLLVEINKKLKLIELAKFISYTCGVSMPDVMGTVKQWNAFMFNLHKKEREILPLESLFKDKQDDLTIFNHFKKKSNNNFEKDIINKFKNIIEFNGQTFPGGITKGAIGLFHDIFSLDFASLYPSIIMWANIGLDTIILPENLPKELLELRIKYAIYYKKNISAKDLIQLDLEFQEKLIRNPIARKEVSETLKKYNVTMTPNGMFFSKEKRSVASKAMELIYTKRNEHKQKMLNLINKLENSKNISNEQIKELKNGIDLENVYNLGLKILINSAYGSLSVLSAVFAGQKEFFSGAVTSGSRNANLIACQANNFKMFELLKTNGKDVLFGFKTNLDNTPYIDTDSGYFSLEPIMKVKFGENYKTELDQKTRTDFVINYVNKIALPETYKALEIYSNTLNAMLPEKLKEDHEIVANNMIIVAPKMNITSVTWSEGTEYKEAKIKVTGLSMIRSTTPSFFREKLKPVMKMLVNNKLESVKNYIKETKKELLKQEPKKIAINQGVTSLDYIWTENIGKFRRKVVEKNKVIKYLSAPINSRASLIHNKFIESQSISEIPEIEAGDKISFVHLKEPNICSSNVFAFKQQEIFKYKNLERFIDYDLMFEKQFINNIKLITEPLKWSLSEETENKINEDEW